MNDTLLIATNDKKWNKCMTTERNISENSTDNEHDQHLKKHLATSTHLIIGGRNWTLYLVEDIRREKKTETKEHYLHDIIAKFKAFTTKSKHKSKMHLDI